MFGFLKELVAAAKEGLDEAKDELAEDKALRDEQERVERETRAADLAARMAAAPAEEIFAVALGAVYRETFLGELTAATEQGRPAAYLYLCAVPADEVESIGKLLRRDFDAKDAAGVAWGVSQLQESLDRAIRPTADAVVITRACWLATAAVGAGLLERDAALELTAPFADRARLVYESWAGFGQDFLTGERELPGSNPLGRRALGKTVEALVSTPSSPWQEVPWPAAVEPPPEGSVDVADRPRAAEPGPDAGRVEH